MRSLLVGFCAFCASIMQALAQMPADPVFDWSGYYVGLDAGATYGHSEHTVIRPAELKPSAATFGVHGGYRVQLENGFVLGWELAAAKQSHDMFFEFFSGSSSQGAQIKYQWDGSLRATFGQAFGRSLIYGIGGLSVIDADACGFVVTRPSRHRRGAFIPCVPGSEANGVRFGWVAGVGASQALNDRVALRVEYLFADYGTQRFITPAAITDFTDISIRTHSVRIGISALLGSNGPHRAASGPVSDWSGFYFGAHGVLLRQTANFQFPAFASTTGDFDLNTGGFGVTAGYNWQRSNFVLGIEGDLTLLDGSGSTYCPNPLFICSASFDALATLRARAGIIRGNLLVYLSAGVALAQTRAEAIFRGNGATTELFEGIAPGFSGGIGAEWRFSEHWSAKAEYLYLDFGVIHGPPVPSVTDIRIAGNLWRLGLNWHF